MRKSLLFAALMLFGISLGSCEKGAETEPQLVEVTLSSGSQDAKSRTLVTASGVTRWAKDDEVRVVDIDQTSRVFKYTGTTPQSYGEFIGNLYGGQGPQTYYAYYGPSHAPCTLGGNYILEITRQDLNLTESAEINSATFGRHCPMVAIPSKFDVKSPSAGFEFHHVSCLIEASIAFESSSKWNDIDFDKVVFELSTDPKAGTTPFNTKVTIDLKQVKGKPDNDVEIPYTESAGKTNVISTTLNYSSPKNLGNLIASAEHGCYSVPIFALPTTADFKCYANVYFYLKGARVCRLNNSGGFAGLNPAGLNVLSFDENNAVPL